MKAVANPSSVVSSLAICRYSCESNFEYDGN